MTAPRWTMVRVEYPSAAIEVGPEDLALLRQAIDALTHTYPGMQDRWSDDERARLNDLRHNFDDLWYALMKHRSDAKTVKEAYSLDSPAYRQ